MISLWLVVFLIRVSCSSSPVKDGTDSVHRLPQVSKQNRWNLVKDKFGHAEKSFIKPEGKKPTLYVVRPSLSLSNSSRISKNLKSGQRLQPGSLQTVTSFPRNNYPSAFSVDSVCSPERYTVTLIHGNCTLPVQTTMCYGICKSYTVPDTSSFYSPVSARHGLGNVCHCCAATLGQTTTKRHDMTCSINGRQSTKTFYVPVAGGCQCRPCVVN